MHSSRGPPLRRLLQPATETAKTRKGLLDIAHDKKLFVPELQCRRIFAQVLVQAIHAAASQRYPHVATGAVALEVDGGGWILRAAHYDREGNERSLRWVGQRGQSRRPRFAGREPRSVTFTATALPEADGWAVLTKLRQPKRTREAPEGASATPAAMVYQLGLLLFDLISSASQVPSQDAKAGVVTTLSLPAFCPPFAGEQEPTLGWSPAQAARQAAGADHASSSSPALGELLSFPDENGDSAPRAGVTASAMAATAGPPAGTSSSPATATDTLASDHSRQSTVQAASAVASSVGGAPSAGAASAKMALAVAAHPIAPGHGCGQLLTALLNKSQAERERFGLLGIVRHPWLAPAARLLGFDDHEHFIRAAERLLLGQPSTPAAAAATPAISAQVAAAPAIAIAIAVEAASASSLRPSSSEPATAASTATHVAPIVSASSSSPRSASRSIGTVGSKRLGVSAFSPVSGGVDSPDFAVATKAPAAVPHQVLPGPHAHPSTAPRLAAPSSSTSSSAAAAAASTGFPPSSSPPAVAPSASAPALVVPAVSLLPAGTHAPPPAVSLLPAGIHAPPPAVSPALAAVRRAWLAREVTESATSSAWCPAFHRWLNGLQQPTLAPDAAKIELAGVELVGSVQKCPRRKALHTGARKASADGASTSPSASTNPQRASVRRQSKRQLDDAPTRAAIAASQAEANARSAQLARAAKRLRTASAVAAPTQDSLGAGSSSGGSVSSERSHNGGGRPASSERREVLQAGMRPQIPGTAQHVEQPLPNGRHDYDGRSHASLSPGSFSQRSPSVLSEVVNHADRAMHGPWAAMPDALSSQDRDPMTEQQLADMAMRHQNQADEYNRRLALLRNERSAASRHQQHAYDVGTRRSHSADPMRFTPSPVAPGGLSYTAAGRPTRHPMPVASIDNSVIPPQSHWGTQHRGGHRGQHQYQGFGESHGGRVLAAPLRGRTEHSGTTMPRGWTLDVAAMMHGGHGSELAQLQTDSVGLNSLATAAANEGDFAGGAVGHMHDQDLDSMATSASIDSQPANLALGSAAVTYPSFPPPSLFVPHPAPARRALGRLDASHGGSGPASHAARYARTSPQLQQHVLVAPPQPRLHPSLQPAVYDSAMSQGQLELRRQGEMARFGMRQSSPFALPAISPPSGQDPPMLAGAHAINHSANWFQEETSYGPLSDHAPPGSYRVAHAPHNHRAPNPDHSSPSYDSARRS